MTTAMKYLWMLALLAPFSAHAGAWLQAKDGLLMSTQALYYSTDSYFDAGGSKQPQRHFSKQELNLYLEYGWRENVTLGTNLFLNHVNQGDDNVGLADPEFFARFPLLKTGHAALSIQPLIKLPSSYQHGGTPRGGSQSTDAELSLLYGQNLPLISAQDYVDARIGYRERSRGLKGQYRADISYGLYPTPALLFVPSMRAVIATADDTQTFREDGEQNYDLYKAEANLYYAVNDFQQISIGYFAHIAGRQTGAGQGFSVGLVQRF